jgi:hypothetical protein
VRFGEARRHVAVLFAPLRVGEARRHVALYACTHARIRYTRHNLTLHRTKHRHTLIGGRASRSRRRVVDITSYPLTHTIHTQSNYTNNHRNQIKILLTPPTTIKFTLTSPTTIKFTHTNTHRRLNVARPQTSYIIRIGTVYTQIYSHTPAIEITHTNTHRRPSVARPQTSWRLSPRSWRR